MRSALKATQEIFLNGAFSPQVRNGATGGMDQVLNGGKDVLTAAKKNHDDWLRNAAEAEVEAHSLRIRAACCT